MITMNQEILLCLVALILFPFAAGGEANIQVHHPALLHGSVRMSYSPSQKMGTMHFISWKYTTKNRKRLSILDTTKIYPSPFTNRLQISDDFYTLTIMDLTIEDGGIYIIDATDTNGETEDNSFNVTIYEPTPQPTITTHMEEITKERCNVTLNCSVPSQTSDLSYIWKSRHQNSTYQLYSNERTIQISAPPDHQDMELLCIVQSPADQKNVSIRVTHCTGTGKKIITPRSRNHIIIPILIIIIVILAITVAVIYIRTKHKGSSEPKENRNAEIDYIEVTTQRLEDNQRIEVENDHYIGMPSPQKVKAETVYTTLQHPQPKYNR